jgi:hypothetical protein
MMIQRRIFSALSFATLAMTCWGWHVPSKVNCVLVDRRSRTATTKDRKVDLAFIPKLKSEDFIHVVQRDEPEDTAVIHTDTDDAERSLDEAYAEYTEMLQNVRNDKPFVGSFNLEKPREEGPKTPREKHFLLTALDSWKRTETDSSEFDPCYEDTYWDSWPLFGI